MEKVYDVHVHCTFEIPLDETIEIFKEEFAVTETEKYAFLSSPHDTESDKKSIYTDYMQNIKALYLKKEFSPNAYAFAGLIHPDSYDDTDAVADEFLRQVKEYTSVGFDGIKMLEGYPSLLKLRNLPLDSPVYDKFYAFCEENEIPIVAHIANPAENWDITKASKQAIDAGRVYDDTYPTKAEITAQTFRVLEKFPKLRLALAHCGFLAYDIKEAEKFMDYENTILDITPGGEQLLIMSRDWGMWKKFVEKYRDRIIYGTDYYAFPKDENWEVCFTRRPKLIRELFETDEEHVYVGKKFKGINLDKKLRDKIYRENFMEFLGDPTELDEDWLAAQAEKVLAEKKFRRQIDKPDAEYIVKMIK